MTRVRCGQGPWPAGSRSVFWLAALLAVAVALAAACSGGNDDTPAPADDGGEGDSQAADAGSDFPSGEQVLISADYIPPEDRVDATGAFLPANGKPTLVYVDAIW